MLYKPLLNDAQKKTMACIRALENRQCRCGRGKQRGMAFCSKCWLVLPQDIRRALYKRMKEGFEAAYDAAVSYLNQDEKEEHYGQEKA